MAKLNRERKMFFGSWTGNAIVEAATIDVGDSTGITGGSVVAATFGTKVNGLSGEYTFVYDGTGWTLNCVAAELTGTNGYGVTVTGTPAANDIVVVTYTAASSAWEALGKDTDDLSKELNPDTETSKNVLGETTFKHNAMSLRSLWIRTSLIRPARCTSIWLTWPRRKNTVTVISWATLLKPISLLPTPKRA